MRMQDWSLALLSGLKIQRCCELCIGHSRSSEPQLLWLWCRLAATTLIPPLAWELPYAVGAASLLLLIGDCHLHSWQVTNDPWRIDFFFLIEDWFFYLALLQANGNFHCTSIFLISGPCFAYLNLLLCNWRLPVIYLISDSSSPVNHMPDNL